VKNEKEELIYSLKIDPEKRAEKSPGFTRKRKLLVVSVIALLALAGFGLNQFLKDPQVDVVRAKVVQEGLPDIVLTAGGYVEADSTILISSQINGQVKSIKIEEGQFVHKGDLLATIEDNDYRAKYNLTKADLDLASATLKRKTSLYKSGVISRAEYDEAVRQFKVKDAETASAKYFLDNTEVRAPIDGTIIKKEKEAGEFLLPGITSEGVPGSAVMKIADLRVMNVELDILESDLPKVLMDQPAMVFPDALPDHSYKAKVFYISPQADKQKSIVQVKVRIDTPDSLLKPDMSARVYFLKNAAEGKVARRIVIPETAMFARDGKNYVFTVVKDQLKEKPVEVAEVKDGQAYLASGLEGDDSVVEKTRKRFHDGMKVVVKSAVVAD